MVRVLRLKVTKILRGRTTPKNIYLVLVILYTDNGLNNFEHNSIFGIEVGDKRQEFPN